MYDTPGSDQGHEWIEVTNTGSTAVDISKYHLLEANTNHKLSIITGSPALGAGASAVLADDSTIFAKDWPQFAGVLFDTTFSLSNTGEVLAITDASSTVQDSVSYTSSMGASGDGGSLHKSGSTFVPAMPNPGVYPGTLTAVAKKDIPVSVAKKPVTKIKTATVKTQSTDYKDTSNIAAAAASGVPVPSESAPENSGFTVFDWLLGLGAIIVVGIAGVYIAAQGKTHTLVAQETPSEADEFSINDDY